jgi:TetR/AcrR family transcriptional regulator, transcriptional repressor for nem operon
MSLPGAWAEAAYDTAALLEIDRGNPRSGILLHPLASCSCANWSDARSSGPFLASLPFLTERSKMARMLPGMPRPIEFDRAEVLDQAIEVFRQRGYQGASIQELVDRMGIQRGSLYGAFGDKHRLFLAALDRYEEVFHAAILGRLEQANRRGGCRQAIRCVFQDVARSCSSHEGRKGCLMTNSAVELGARDRDTRARVAANLSRLEDAFCRALRTAQADGELSPEPDARALGRFLTSSLQGLRVMAKARPEPALLRDVVRMTLTVLD